MPRCGAAELTTRSAIDTAGGLVAESERSVRSAKEEVDAGGGGEAHDSQPPGTSARMRVDFREVFVRRKSLGKPPPLMPGG
jgi:hypothetical protein